MELQIWGGAGEHGRSCYFLKLGSLRLLFDCGVKKGAADPYPLMDGREVGELDAVFLSHSHEDHSAAIPLLYHKGYRGKVYTLQPTVEQYGKYIDSWSELVWRQGQTLPYTEADMRNVRFQVLPAPSGVMELGGGVRLYWGRSGHLLGAVWFLVAGFGRAFFYSGDYTPESLLLQADSPLEALSRLGMRDPYIDLAVIDSAYATDATAQGQYVERLLEVCLKINDRGGKALLPLPAYGRGQELLCLLNSRLDHIPIAVEQAIIAPLEQYASGRALLHQAGRKLLDAAMSSERLAAIRDDDMRERWLHHPGPAILMTTDGMLTSKRSQQYLSHLQNDARNGVVFTGHVAPGTPGHRLLSGHHAREVKLQVEFCLYKVHQGLPEVRNMLEELRPKRAILCHAPLDRTEQLASLLSGQYPQVTVALPGQRMAAE